MEGHVGPKTPTTETPQWSCKYLPPYLLFLDFFVMLEQTSGEQQQIFGATYSDFWPCKNWIAQHYLRMDHSHPCFLICFLQPSCTVSLLVLGNSAVLTSRKDAPSTTRLRRSTDTNIVCWQANRSIPRAVPPSFHRWTPTPQKNAGVNGGPVSKGERNKSQNVRPLFWEVGDGLVVMKLCPEQRLQ